MNDWQEIVALGLMCFFISVGMGSCCLLISLADKIH